MKVYLVWCDYDFGTRVFDSKSKAMAYIKYMIQRVGHEGEWNLKSYEVE